MAMAMLHSSDPHGTHEAELQPIEILERVGNNDYLVLTPAGVKCHALFNPYCGYWFADDLYRIEPEGHGKGEQTP